MHKYDKGVLKHNNATAGLLIDSVHVFWRNYFIIKFHQFQINHPRETTHRQMCLDAFSGK